MNKTFIIGNLTKDPELRTTQSGVPVCSFTVAVNRPHTAQAGQQEADYFRVTAWRKLGESCSKWLIKGRKVSVVGSVSASAYVGKDGQAHAQMEINADDVEFLSPANTVQDVQAAAPVNHEPQYTQVDDEDLPF